ncbi:MAG TPA: histidinol dehydrogenase [Chitinophagales bacterium]|nr:histidinol dehydrogenase [Chitinophagales bacterium]
MQTIKYSKLKDMEALLQRPTADFAVIEKPVAEILRDVKKNGDAALRKYALKFDKATVKDFLVTVEEINKASDTLDKELKQAIKTAYANIKKFHKAQRLQTEEIETTKGVMCWREARAIQNVGLYIPGGSAPLFSTVLMLATPAHIAGCQRIVLCTPPDKEGNIHPAILFAAKLCGVHEVYKTGGAQAIAAMAYGTESIAKTDKIFGPGNQYVTVAKQLVQQQGVAIDMPAGPSEVMVVGDESCDPAFIAADLLSQAEHGPDSQVVFIALNESLISQVKKEVALQLQTLPRKDIATQALAHSKIILVKSHQDALHIINEYAPEHLILAVKNEDFYLKGVVNAGSVFIGNYTPESAGDYASGTNHTLPTGGYARVYGGVSLDAFVKKITYQKISAKGIKNIGPVIETMAAAEQLYGHKNAVSIRLKKLKQK